MMTLLLLELTQFVPRPKTKTNMRNTTRNAIVTIATTFLFGFLANPSHAQNVVRDCDCSTVRQAIRQYNTTNQIDPCTQDCPANATCTFTTIPRTGESCRYRNAAGAQVDTCHIEFRYARWSGTGCSPSPCFDTARWRYEANPDSLCPAATGPRQPWEGCP